MKTLSSFKTNMIFFGLSRFQTEAENKESQIWLYSAADYYYYNN